jgi:hypothetical protein
LAGSGDVVAQTKKSANAPSAPRPANIDRNGVLILIRSSLLALDQANKTGNYTVLRDLGAPQFQVNTAAKLAEVFVKERQQSLDLSGVAVLDPQLTLLPQIESNGMMRIGGFFPSVPNQLNFELMYAPVNREWKLSVSQSASANPVPLLPALTIPSSQKSRFLPSLPSRRRQLSGLTRQRPTRCDRNLCVRLDRVAMRTMVCVIGLPQACRDRFCNYLANLYI